MPAKAAISLALHLANQTELVVATSGLTALGALSAGCITSLLISMPLLTLLILVTVSVGSFV